MDVNDAIRALTEFIMGLNLEAQSRKDVFKGSTVLISRGDRTLILVGGDADKYTDIRASIYDAVAQRRPVSNRAVRDIVDDFFLKALESGDREHNPDLAEQSVSQVQELKTILFEKPKNWEVRLIVEGLAPSGLPVTVGQVRFLCLDEVSLSALKERVREHIRKLAVRDSDAVALRMSTNLEALRGKTIGVLSVNAVDDEAAILAAKHKLQTTVDAINFFASRERMGGWVFLPGDTMPQTELVLAICEDDRLTPSFRRAGPVRQIPLNQIASRKGFSRVSDMLGKDAPARLEERILASLQWAGRAQVEARREEAFLLYAIALESLLLGRDTKSEISHRLAVRCAHVGGGPTLDDKRRVVEEILSLYRTRSDIVHSGNFLVNEAELNLIRDYSVLTLFMIIDTEPFRSMNDLEDLERWFEAQLLSGGISRT